MTKVLRVGDDGAALISPTTMAIEKRTETTDLEPWLIDNIGAIDPALKVVTTQFNRWTSEAGAAAERLDILALAESGELVVIELKRDTDRNIHLQAISYGALVSGFTTSSLGQVHADWLDKTRRRPGVGVEEASDELREHVLGDWSDEVLQQTRLILVAEKFPPLVLTTIQWLNQRAPELRIECHQYTVFRDNAGLMIAFDRLYPVDDLSDRFLVPSAHATSAATTVATTQRQAKTTVRLHELRAIPVGSKITLELSGQAKPERAVLVNTWLDENPARRDVTWIDSPNRPLRWAAEPTVESWTPSALRDLIFESAGVKEHTSSALDAWSYQGKSLFVVANEATRAAQNG